MPFVCLEAFLKFTWKEAKGRGGDSARTAAFLTARGVARRCLRLFQKSTVTVFKAASISSAHVRVLSSASLLVPCRGSRPLPSKFQTLKHPEFGRRWYWKWSVCLPRSKLRSEHVQICTVWILGGRSSAGKLHLSIAFITFVFLILLGNLFYYYYYFFLKYVYSFNLV